MLRKVFKKKNARRKYAQYDYSPQAPILVSDASIEDLSLSAPHQPCSPCCVPQKAERGEDSRGIEELFFNKEVGSNVSEFGKPCANDECEQAVEVKKTCSCLLSEEPKQAAKSLPLCKIIQESGGASSFPDTECSSWDASARAHYYHHKLMATLQVLANKEETVRVQAESLRVAEARIAALAARAERLRGELRSLHLSSDKPERADAAVTADAQEDCTCHLEEENMRLKEINENMQIQVGELRQKIGELEAALSDKEKGDNAYREALAEKEQELALVKQQLHELQETADDRSAACDALATQLRQALESIEKQSCDLAQAQRCERDLRAAHAEESRLRAELNDLQEQLARAQLHCRGLHAGFRDKATCAATLQAQLEEAHARGAALCDEVRRVVGGVQLWVRRMRARHREQENKIKEQETLIKALQFEKNDAGLHELTNDRCCSKCSSLRPKRSRGRVSETDGCECVADDCNRDIGHTPEVRERRDDHKKNSRSEIDCECSSRIEHIQVRRKQSISEMGSCVCSSRGERRHDRANTSRNETASCECSRVGESRGDKSKSGSEVASCSSAPTPPRRLLKKKFNPCEEMSWWWGTGTAGTSGTCRRDAGVQQPARRDARSGACCGEACRPGRVPVRLPREASPSAELEQRVSALHVALRRARGRWAHAHTT